jgi:mannosyltransferase
VTRLSTAFGKVTPDSRRQRAAQRWVIVLTLASFALVMWRIDARSIWWDESLSLFRAQQDLGYILSNRIDFPGIQTIDQHPPLYFLVLGLTIRIAGESDLALRLPSALSATLLVPLLYVVGRRLRSVRVGLLAASLGTLSPLYLWYGQEARMYTSLTSLALLGFYCLWRELDTPDWRWLAGCLLAVVAGIATHYLFVLVLPCYFGLVMARWWRRRSRPQSALQVPERGCRDPGSLWHRVLLVPILFLSLAAAGHAVLGLIPALRTYRQVVPLRIMLVDVVNSFNLGLSVNIRQVWLLNILFGAVFIFGFLSLYIYKDDNLDDASSIADTGLVFIIGFSLLPILFMWALSFAVPLYTNSRYAMLGSSGYYIGMALGLDALYRWRRSIGGLMVALVAAGMLMSIGRYQFLERYQQKEAYAEVAHFIATNERVGDAIIIAGPESLTAFEHYYQGPLPVLGLPEVGWTQERLEQELEIAAQTFDRLWFVQGRVQFSDPHERTRRWLAENTLALLHRGYPSSGAYLAVEARLPQSPLQDSSSVEAPRGTWGKGLTLADYAVRYWDADGIARQIKADEANATWAAEQPVGMWAVPVGKTISAEVITRVDDALPPIKGSMRLVRDGIVWAQRDSDLVTGYPTAEWPIGGIIRWESDIRVHPGTPPGLYELGLWLYHADDGQPIPFSSLTSDAERLYYPLGHILVTWPEERALTKDILPLGVETIRWRPRFAQLELLVQHLSTSAMRPDEGIWMQLFWRARRPVPTDYRLVVNWRDAGGTVWHTSEHGPCGVDLGTSQWQPGHVVRGMLLLTVPPDAPPGRHSVHILLYDPSRSRFLPLARDPLPWIGRNWMVGWVDILPAPSP